MKLEIGSIWYDPIQNEIRECVGISQDHLSQPMGLFTPVKKKKDGKLYHFGVTAWVVFKYFEKLEDQNEKNQSA